jgi:energy-coupling factor transporter ATP-binding protein EcfA2
MGYLAQDSSVFKQLSVEDNLMAILQTRRDMSRRRRKERQNELLDQFGLTRIRKTKANRVSGGERRRLEIARSLITEPKLIMLDEPFAGIDPKTVAEIQDQIRSLVETYNIGILLTDHNIRETLQVTDRSYVIRDGMVFAYGNPEQILNNADVRRHYIGDRFDVGHLLDQRRVHSIGESKGDPGAAPPPPGAVNWVAPEGDPSIGSPPTNLAPAAAPRADGVIGHDDALRSFVETGDEPPAVGVPQPPPTPGPGPLTPEDRAYMERFFGGSVTVLGDVVIERMDVEVEPDPADGRRRPPG